MNFSPILGFVDVHAAVVPGELLARLYALVLGSELGRALALQLLDVAVEAGDGDGRVAEHARGLQQPITAQHVWSPALSQSQLTWKFILRSSTGSEGAITLALAMSNPDIRGVVTFKSIH